MVRTSGLILRIKSGGVGTEGGWDGMDDCGDAPGIPSEGLRRGRSSLQTKKRKRKCTGESFSTARQWVGTGPLRSTR